MMSSPRGKPVDAPPKGSKIERGYKVSGTVEYFYEYDQWYEVECIVLPDEPKRIKIFLQVHVSPSTFDQCLFVRDHDMDGVPTLVVAKYVKVMDRYPKEGWNEKGGWLQWRE